MGYQQRHQIESAYRVEAAIVHVGKWMPGQYPKKMPDGTEKIFEVQRVTFKDVKSGARYVLNIDRKHEENAKLWEPYAVVGNVLEVGILPASEDGKVKADSTVNKMDNFQVVKNVSDEQTSLV